MKKKLFSVHSGLVYELDEKYTKTLDNGQLEITNLPKSSCKKCYGRGYIHRNIKTGHYNMCSCCLRDADEEFLRNAAELQLEDVILHTKKSDFDSAVDEIYS